MAGHSGITIKDFEDMMASLSLSRPRPKGEWDFITGEGGIKLLVEKHPQEFISLYQMGIIKCINEESKILLDQLYQEVLLKIKKEDE